MGVAKQNLHRFLNNLSQPAKSALGRASQFICRLNMPSFIRLAATVTLTWLTSIMVVSVRAETITIQGSTTFNAELIVDHLPALEAAAHHQLVVIANKSNLGLVALFEGKADLAMISTDLVNEISTVQRMVPDAAVERLEVFPIARTTAALVTHPSNPVHAISREMLRKVLAGEITDWKDLGGLAMPIRIASVREGGGVIASVEGSVLGVGKHITAPDRIWVQNGSQIVKIVEQEPGALGITQAKLAKARAVNFLKTGDPIEQRLSLVSLGVPSVAMRDVVTTMRQAAIASGLD